MVAAGGGYIGVTMVNDVTAGSQNNAGVTEGFGSGGFGYGFTSPNNNNTSGGGGAGWFGGGASAGGSGYIGNTNLTNKAMYCFNCATSNEESTKTISTTCTSATPTANCAKQGNGYARITYLGNNT